MLNSLNLGYLRNLQWDFRRFFGWPFYPLYAKKYAFATHFMYPTRNPAFPPDPQACWGDEYGRMSMGNEYGQKLELYSDGEQEMRRKCVFFA